MAKIRDLKMSENSITTKHYAVTYYQTLEEVCCHTGLEKLK